MEIPTQQPSTGGNDVAAFKKFDAYPWIKDRSFLQGLVAMLGPLSNGFERQKALGISLQARVWWYKSRFSIDIDRSAYENYLLPSSSPSTPSHSQIPNSPVDAQLVDKLAEIQQLMGTTPVSASDDDLPAWQVQAPKVDLLKKADDGDADGAERGANGNAPYPERFNAIIELITNGTPVPGIKEIPNTVVRQPGISPIGKMQAPQKPWEKKQQQAAAANLVTSEVMIDREFPPLPPEDEDQEHQRDQPQKMGA
ncbi:hypothetical protein GE21DRAFT_3256 [Neurospora crassa]|uniref:Uncharacterized protein n=3 Tax=Neurospora crassa TaxID=5141 RepID=V5INI4_NEUCR|nr:hypothetical protein NCU01766 [Neurospora crassa OR74A]ESA43617.1 hypothetical protein NCU01766 [Neurospora crassa OR74A]KHE83586.1 hypothetical protein GE21DRAFT_3256 [Neurospora crassa]CAD01111.1 hypothetical protein [Neurospora crassa]|eukprot:XP_011393505.1 hypothetical protein NCU01766 [Neurospora crassa OR74A]